MSVENKPTNGSSSEQAPSKEQLVEVSRQLAQLCDFKPKESKSLEAVRAGLQDNQTALVQALQAVYADAEPDVKKSLTTDPDIQLAFLLNIQKMVEHEKVRKDGSPYYTHPQSVSQRLAAFAPADREALRDGMIGSLLHDYLEEGDGVSVESIRGLEAAFPENKNLAQELVLLTEPNFIEKGAKERPDLPQAVDYDALKAETGYGRKTLEIIAFALMMRESRVMQLVVPVDKLDNVGDCDVVVKKKIAKDIPDKNSPEFHEQAAKRTAETLTKFSLYARMCELPEAAATRQALESAVKAKISSLVVEFPEMERLVEAKTKEFETLMQDPKIRQPLTKQLKDYFSGLGITFFEQRWD